MTALKSHAQTKYTHLCPVAIEDKLGYINASGEMAIKPQYSAAGAFYDGLALVRTAGMNGKWGYIDGSGAYVIQPAYSNATDFSEGIAFVSSGISVFDAINIHGDKKFTVHATDIHNFSEGRAAFAMEGKNHIRKYGFIDTNGSVQIEAQFWEVSCFSGGLCAVKKDKTGLWGYIDTSGKLVIDYQYEEAGPFENNMAVVHKKYCGIIDKQGKYLVDERYWQMAVDGDKILVSENAKWGWIDTHGKVLIPLKFSGAMRFGGGKYAPVLENDKWGYIDAHGQYFVKPQFAHAHRWHDGALANKSSTLCVLNNTGAIVKEMYYTALSPDCYQADNSDGIQGQYYSQISDQTAEIAAKEFLTALYNNEWEKCKQFVSDKDKNYFTLLSQSFPSSGAKRQKQEIYIDKVSSQGAGALVTYHITNFAESKNLIMLNEKGSWIIIDPQHII